jgi:NADPH-dependent 2,4-dienoyl-CoA reductase/sulfur reductase-like enzyme/pSer/pThr/pTyr-binding forkhead associated (FHA) protein
MAEQMGPTYLIIGNGIAGITAAEILRSEDSASTIAVIADDPFPVYYRPALKDYLGGRVREDKLWARPRSFYQDHNIYFHADRVVGIQPDKHVVQLQSGRRLGYHRLLLANGARAAQLSCPGLDLNGVTTLRTVADYQKILSRLNSVRRVVVSGSGTLALETVETLRHRGFSVTHLLRRRTIWSEVLDATASDLVLQEERHAGVDVRLEDEIEQITGKGGEVTGVVTKNGDRIACEMVIIAIGIEPTIDFVRNSGILCGRGVRVDGKMHTSAPDIYAAGDILETMDELTGRSRVIGQWYPAIQQARAAAYSMLDLLDTDRPFKSSTFYNATFLYGLDFASVGISNLPGFQEIVAPPKPRMYRKVLLKNGIPVGMLSLGNRKQALAFKRAIDTRTNLAPVLNRLFDDDFKLNDWLDQQGVPVPQLGVTRVGDKIVQQVAYPEKTRTGTSGINEQKPKETVLVPAPEFARVLQLSEQRLSQTRVVSIGRQPGIALLVDEGTVSRRHAEISYANGQYILLDVGSSNGTFVNGQRLKSQAPYILQPDDTIRFGTKVKFTFKQRAVDPKLKVAMSSVTMIGLPYDPRKDNAPLGLPVFSMDGSLLLPGTTVPVPVDVVKTFKSTPALLLVKSANQPPEVCLLKQGKHTLIGRDEGNDIEIIDVAVSRRHAEILPGPDGFYVRDLGSSNGVIVNQTSIDNPYQLSHGDRITIGGHVIYYIDLQAERRTSSPLKAYAAAPQQAEGTVKVGAIAAQQISDRIPVPVATSSQRPQSQQRPTNQPNPQTPQGRVDSSPLVVCRKCGLANTRIARFCASCSAPLGTGSLGY